MALSLAISSLIIISMAVGALFGFFRGFRRTIVTLISVVAAAALSFAFSALIAKIFINNESVIKLFTAINMMDVYNELSDVSPALIELIGSIPVAIVAPLLFVILFFVLKFIFMIPCAIICKVMNIVRKEGIVKRLLGLPLGAVQGFVVALIPIFILAGYFNIADRMITVMTNEESVSSEEKSSDFEQINIYLEEIKKDPVMVVLCNDQDKNNFVFDSLSKFKFRDERVSLTDELVAISDSFIQLTPLMNEAEGGVSLSEKEITALENFVNKFGESKILTEVGAEIISGACEKWSNHEEFIGISFSGVDENIDPIIFALFDSMKCSTAETVKIDMDSFVDILRVFDEHHLLDTSTDNTQSFISNLNGDFINDLLTILSSNERFSAAIPEVTNLSIKMLGSALNLPENAGEVYDNITSDLSTALNEGLTDTDKLASDIHTALEKGGVEVTEDIAEILAVSMADAFADHEGEITKEDVQKYFEDYAIIYEATKSEAGDSASLKNDEITLSGDYSIGYQNFTSYEDTLAIIADLGLLDYYGLSGTNENDVLANGMKAKDFVKYIINIYNSVSNNTDKLNENGEGVLSLKSATDIKTNKLTLDSLMLEKGNYELSAEDIKNISEGVDSVITFISSIQNVEGGISLENIDQIDIELMGKALDSLKKTPLYSESIDPIAEAVIENIVGSSDVKDSLNENVSYESLMGTVKSTANVINKVKDTEASEDDKNQSVVELLETITPENADIITAVVNEKFMIEQGVDAEFAYASAKALKAILREMALLEENEREAESSKILSLFEMVTNINGDVYGDDGVFNSPDDVISVMLYSKVGYAALMDLTEGGCRDALGLASKISGSDKIAIAGELTAYYETVDQIQKSKVAKCFNAVGLLLGLDIDLK